MMKLIIDWFTRHSGKALIPRHYGYSYAAPCSARDIYYPLPINYIVRYWRKSYWGILRLFYWIGFIDTRADEEFRWNDFLRMKVR